MAVNSQQNSPLIRLPTEIRTVIYQYVLSTTKTIYLTSTGLIRLTDIHTPEWCTIHTAILRCCRVIYGEALPVLYHINLFKLENPKDFVGFAGSTSDCSVKLASINHLVLARSEHLNATRTKELRRLPNLQRLAFMETWGERMLGCYKSPKETNLNLEVEDMPTGNTEERALAFWVRAWSNQTTWSSSLRDMMLARARVSYAIVLMPDSWTDNEMYVLGAPPSPLKVIEFGITWNSDRQRYILRPRSIRRRELDEDVLEWIA